MVEKPSGEMRRRAWGALISSAFFTWQTALIIAISIVLFGLSVRPFDFWAPPLWLVFGAVGTLLYVGATITDPRAQQRAIARMLTEKYSPARIQNPAARSRLEKALEYYGAMQKVMMSRKATSRVEFEHALDEVDDWIAQLYLLGKKIDSFEENNIINRDRMQVRNELDALNRRLKVERDHAWRKNCSAQCRSKKRNSRTWLISRPTSSAPTSRWTTPWQRWARSTPRCRLSLPRILTGPTPNACVTRFMTR
ncbi:MAG: hypothetical protein HC915_18685 [Anaerolineae bacterium]|nr:hypothetical protein [Anaerolineae bacterium]